jgi:hypothetical protein
MIVMVGSLTGLYRPIGRVGAVIMTPFLDQSVHMPIWMMCLGIKTSVFVSPRHGWTMTLVVAVLDMEIHIVRGLDDHMWDIVAVDLSLVMIQHMVAAVMV